MNAELEENPENTVLNFGLVFRCDLGLYQRIKAQLLKQGASLIYQTCSAGKIFIKKEDNSGGSEWWSETMEQRLEKNDLKK